MTSKHVKEIPIGARFGRLTVVGIGEVTTRRRLQKWLCRCDCGVVKSYYGSKLRCGHAKGCGCRRTAVVVKRGDETEKLCARCVELKPLDNFRPMRRFRRGQLKIYIDAWCLECRRQHKQTAHIKKQTREHIMKRRRIDEAFREKQRRRSESNYEKNRAAEIARRQANPQATKLNYLDARLRKQFDFGLLEYEQMLAAQNNCCAICGGHETTKLRRLSIDHDHATNEVRGLLCGLCNTGLGCFRDDIGILIKAIHYLAKHSKIREVS